MIWCRFELEGELLEELDDMRFSIDIRVLDQKSAEVLVLLFGRERTEQLQRICLERDLLIRSIDCSAYALFREMIHPSGTMQQFHEGKTLPSLDEHAGFQFYLGADEAFINTVQGQRLEEIKFFPNRLPELSAGMTENGRFYYVTRFVHEEVEALVRSYFIIKNCFIVIVATIPGIFF